MPEQKQQKQAFSVMKYGSEMNAQIAIIETLIKQRVNTCIPVRVDSVEKARDGSGARYVSATPLICQTDHDGKALPMVTIPKLPYFRLQHGSAAVICDPEVGDVGLAVFAKQDCSSLNGGAEPVAPGSFRSFDMSDGFYLGGFWGKTPKTYIWLDSQSETIKVKAKQLDVEVETFELNAQSVNLNVQGDFNVNCPKVKLTGALDVAGHVMSGSVSMQGHTHRGVKAGDESSGIPNQ